MKSKKSELRAVPPITDVLQAFSLEETASLPLVMRIKNLPVPKVDCPEMLEMYIKPYIWEGAAYFDEGWSSYKDEISNKLAVGEPLNGFILPFLLSPQNKIEEKEVELEGGFKSLTTIETDRKWHIAFPGEQFVILLHAIEAIREIGVEKQEYILTSYFTSQLPKEGKEIYQLHIIATQKGTEFRVNKGNWIPNFENCIPISGWK